MLAVPFGVLGACSRSLVRGIQNDLYLPVGLVTVVGLAAKNAILIWSSPSSATEWEPPGSGDPGGRERFRPIVMTSSPSSSAGAAGIATGAGAGSRKSLGTGVIGGMLAATILAVFFMPLFFTVVMRLTTRSLEEGQPCRQCRKRTRTPRRTTVVGTRVLLV